MDGGESTPASSVQGLAATVRRTEGTGEERGGAANSPGPREWPEGAAEVEVAMAGGMELTALADWAL